MIHVLKQFMRRTLNAPGWEHRDRKLPAMTQWRQFFVTLTGREKLVLSFGAVLLVTGLSIAGVRGYFQRTEIVPASGGTLTVGVVGRPLYVNPALAPSNIADSELEHLIFSGLFRYDTNGELVPVLAESWAVGDFGKVIEVTIRDGIRWPDGEPFTAEDVAFTFQSIQNPDIRSPLLASWTGINIQVVDLKTVRFTLPAPYSPFLSNLTTGILPRHLWEEVAPENFSLSEQNLQPMGLGPYQPKRFERTRDGRILSYELEPNPSSPEQPMIQSVIFRFFNQYQEALVAFNRGEVKVIGPLGVDDAANVRSGAALRNAALPRTFSVFMNPAQSKVLAVEEVRQAFAYTTDRDPLLALLGGEPFVTELTAPIPEGLPGATTDAAPYVTNVDEAIRLLEEIKFAFPEAEKNPESSSQNPDEGATEPKTPVRTSSLGTPLAVTLTHRDDPVIHAVAETLATQWRQLGAEITLRPLTAGAFRRAILDRDYEALLAGQELAPDPDLFAFWHSSQKFDPGGNLALYESTSVDALLEKARGTFDREERAQLHRDAQKLIMETAPTIPLWQEHAVIAVDPGIKGVDYGLLAGPSWRLARLPEWYLRTQRVWR